MALLFKRRTADAGDGRYHPHEFDSAHYPEYSHDNPERVCQCLRAHGLWLWLLFRHIYNRAAAHSNSRPSASTNGDGRGKPAFVGRSIEETSTAFSGW